MRTCQQSNGHAKEQAGFTLLEIMIAMAIGIFMIGAILTIEQGNRTVFVNQNNLSQVQDSERMAMTMITDVIQSAGYFPSPNINVAGLEFPADATFNISQTITGTYNASPPGDTITVRYATSNGDGILNCSGSQNASGSDALYINTFSVVNGQLICSLSVNGAASTPYTLVGDNQKVVVNKLSIVYGVNTAGSVTNNVDEYLTAQQVTTAAVWNKVVSVVVTLKFNNPLWSPGSTGQQQYLTIQRVINVMNQTGPTS